MKKLFLVIIGLFFCIRVFADSVSVTRVVDGDTIEISTGERVRLIGIDTPEVYESNKLYRDAERTGRDKKTIQKLGERASQFTKKMLLGKRVRLEYDQANTHTGHRDRYGRLLAYIYLDSGIFFNTEIIRQGYANVYTSFPFKYMDEFRRLEREARENKRGLWADVEDGDYVASGKSRIFHRVSCKWAGMINEKNKIEFDNRDKAVKEGYRACKVCWP